MKDLNWTKEKMIQLAAEYMTDDEEPIAAYDYDDGFGHEYLAIETDSGFLLLFDACTHTFQKYEDA